MDNVIDFEGVGVEYGPEIDDLRTAQRINSLMKIIGCLVKGSGLTIEALDKFEGQIKKAEMLGAREFPETYKEFQERGLFGLTRKNVEILRLILRKDIK